ncbi:SCO1431 family membrane protein [Streptomyces yokosukanensis]|uniref:SCO1431 family membrane protein n=1 Tax=Streptomyces yokosukanensis TaxID=67386 RepID=UPI003133C6A1
MSKLIAAKGATGGKVDKRVGSPHPNIRSARAIRTSDLASNAMTAHPATATRARTGGPQEDGPKILEHAMGWVLVVVVAMLVTQLGLL